MAAEPQQDHESGADARLASVVHRNIRSLTAARQIQEQHRTASDRIADAVTRFIGSMWCAYVHAALFAAWILINVGLMKGVRPFDPFPFVMLAVFTSVEAIFLSTFILIT